MVRKTETDHVENLFGPFAQKHPLRRQRYRVAPAHEEFLPQLLLQLLQLAGEGRLGDVQSAGRSGHASGVGHAEKIAQYSEFHIRLGSSMLFSVSARGAAGRSLLTIARFHRFSTFRRSPVPRPELPLCHGRKRSCDE